MTEKLAIIDFGSQYTQTIARRFRELDIFAEIVKPTAPIHMLRGYKAYVLSGGPASVYDAGAPKLPDEIWESGVPILCICYGMQLAGQRFGCNVAPGTKREYGKVEVRFTRSDEIGMFAGLPPEQVVWMSHGDSVLEPGTGGFEPLAVSKNGIVAAMKHKSKPIYCVQFHPEVSHTQYGKEMLKNFAYGVCGFKGDWKMEDYIDRAEREIAAAVGNGHASILVSGGVDSTTLACIAKHVLGDRLKLIYLDMGQARKGETEWVVGQLRSLGFSNIEVIDMSDEMLGLLTGIVDAAQKRKAISRRYKQRSIDEINEGRKLLQGTLYPDIIESGWSLQHFDGKETLNRQHADKIKEHHNVEEMGALRQSGELVEPFRYLFKDEVRKLARILGLPPEIAEREPFPGPGLYVRHIGNVKKPDNYGDIEAFVHERAKRHGMKGYLFPILTVGVQGDGRTYKPMAILAGKADWQTMRAAASDIVSSTREVNRVAYCLTHDSLDRDALRNTAPMPIAMKSMALVRELDAIGREVATTDPSYKKVSQMPFNLFAGGWAGIRDFSTEDFMTGRPLEKPDEMPWEVPYEIAKRMTNSPEVKALGGIRGVLLDITDKPPATTEAE
ncbi:MAG: glutamine-hydrolyzing GMP synthase [Candidatus Aenigmatarchaeota archaeon]